MKDEGGRRKEEFPSALWPVSGRHLYRSCKVVKHIFAGRYLDNTIALAATMRCNALRCRGCGARSPATKNLTVDRVATLNLAAMNINCTFAPVAGNAMQRAALPRVWGA